jgi:uncharacterized membrane protein (UPF0127 family)
MHTSKGIILICGMLLMSAAPAETISLSVGKQTIQAEIAATEQSRQHGLMQRKQLCRDCGMLFVFEHAGRHSFWMKNTYLPLAIAFIASDGSILNIAEMQANTTNVHSPQGDILYALEMNRGWFAGHFIQPGDKINGLQHAPPGH